MSITKAIYEHLITKQKYNRKSLEVDVLKEDIARLKIQMKEQEKVFEIKKAIWKETLKAKEEEIIKLKRRNAKNVGINKRRKKNPDKVL